MKKIASKLKRQKENSTIDELGICFFNGTYEGRQKKGSTDIQFKDYIDSVQNPDEDYIKKIELIRKVKKCKDVDAVRKLKIANKILQNHKTVSKIYGALKWNTMHVYPSCQFDKEGCRYKNVISVSGLMGYDLQGLDEDTVKHLHEWKHTVALHKSIGGDRGDYALFLYSPGLTVESYTGQWEKGEQLVQENFGISPTSSDETKDVTRIRYLSYDPDCYYNPFAAPILTEDIIISTEFTTSQKKLINSMLDSEPQWHKFGLALAVTKGESGRELYHKFSKENPVKYNERETDRKYDRLITETKRGRKDGLNPGTLFYMLKEMGVKYSAPKTIGVRTVIDGKEEDLSAVTILEFLNSRWVRNEITDKMINFKTGRDTNVETIWTEFQIQFNEPKININTIHSLLRSERMNTMNPIKNFFEDSRKQYDGRSYIDKFIKSLPCVDYVAADLFIKYWMIQAYLQGVHHETNRAFLILKGQTENIGKSRALGWLCPIENYLKTGPLNTDSKDTRIALANNFIWNDDELKVFRAFDINKIKALISTDVINERTPYSRSAETLHRICSFCGSTNADELLPSTEGNTRFLVVELRQNEKVKWAEYMRLDKYQVWGEVIALHESGWIEKNQHKLNETRTKINELNVVNSTIQDRISELLESSMKDKNRIVMRLIDVINIIDPDDRYKAMTQQNLVRDILIKQFGSSRTNGILYSTDERRLGYPCKVRTV